MGAIILNWHDTDSTVKCVESVLAAPEIQMVFVVDNESDGKLAAKVSDFDDHRVQLIEVSENRGFSAGINVGLRMFLDTSLLFALVINNDAILESDSLTAMVASAKCMRGYGIVGPIIRNPDGTVQSRGECLSPWTLGNHPAREGESIDYLTWACVLIPRITLEIIGLLDERYFMYWEDVEYGERVRKLGGDLIVAEDGYVIHSVSSSHGRAGSRIQVYSALGLALFGRSQGCRGFVVSRIRLVGRCIRSIVELRPNSLVAIISGWNLAMHRESPVYPLVNRFLNLERKHA